MASVRPRRASKRLQALDSFISILEGKGCHHEDKHGKEDSLGSFLATDMIFGDGVGAPVAGIQC